MLLRNCRRNCRYNNHLRNKWSHSKFLQHLSYQTPLSLTLTVTAQIDICRIKYCQTQSSVTRLNISLFTSNCDAKPLGTALRISKIRASPKSPMAFNSGNTNLNQIASRFSSKVYWFAKSSGLSTSTFAKVDFLTKLKN